MVDQGWNLNLVLGILLVILTRAEESSCYTSTHRTFKKRLHPSYTCWMEWIRGLPWPPGVPRFISRSSCLGFIVKISRRCGEVPASQCEYPLTSVAGLIFNPTPMGWDSVRAQADLVISLIHWHPVQWWLSVPIHGQAVLGGVFGWCPNPHTNINLHISSHERVLFICYRLNGCMFTTKTPPWWGRCLVPVERRRKHQGMNLASNAVLILQLWSVKE